MLQQPSNIASLKEAGETPLLYYHLSLSQQKYDELLIDEI